MKHEHSGRRLQKKLMILVNINEGCIVWSMESITPYYVTNFNNEELLHFLIETEPRLIALCKVTIINGT